MKAKMLCVALPTLAQTLRAARDGGWVFQTDHSISSAVAPESYELALKTLRKWGTFPPFV